MDVEVEEELEDGVKHDSNGYITKPRAACGMHVDLYILQLAAISSFTNC